MEERVGTEMDKLINRGWKEFLEELKRRARCYMEFAELWKWNLFLSCECIECVDDVFWMNS